MVDQVMLRCVFRVHKDGVAVGASQRMEVTITQCIDLLAGGGADCKNPGLGGGGGGGTERKGGFALGGGNFQSGTKRSPAILEGISGLRQVLKSIVERNDTGDFL